MNKTTKKMTIILVFVLAAIGISLWFYQSSSVDDEERYITTAEQYEIIETSKGFDYWKSINDDVKMLLVFNDRELPVVVTGDDSYHRKNLEKKYDTMGTPYLNEICDLSSQNLIIMGHSSTRNELMFNFMKNYTDKEYFLANKDFTVVTDESESNYEVIGIISINLEDPEYYLEWYTTSFRHNQDFQWMVNDFIRQSGSDYEIAEDLDQVITFVTCDMRYNDARYIVMAVEVSDENSTAN